MEVAITKASIEQILSNESLIKNIPYIKIVSNSLKTKPNCSKCRQNQGIQDQARLFSSVKNNIQLLPKPHIELIKKALGADSLVVFIMMRDGSTKKTVL